MCHHCNASAPSNTRNFYCIGCGLLRVRGAETLTTPRNDRSTDFRPHKCTCHIGMLRYEPRGPCREVRTNTCLWRGTSEQNWNPGAHRAIEKPRTCFHCAEWYTITQCSLFASIRPQPRPQKRLRTATAFSDQPCRNNLLTLHSSLSLIRCKRFPAKHMAHKRLGIRPTNAARSKL